MKQITKLVPKFAYIVTLFTIMLAMGFTGLYLAVGADLPEVNSIRQIRLQTPMSVYSKDGQLIDEFGDIRRIPITLDQVPKEFINALLATEDVRFYQHSGVDFKGVMRALFKLATTGTKSQGASTITMQVARNYYLSREKRFSRKFTEMFVAWKLESELSKNEILEIFLNKIEFGHRSRGIGAASQIYYGKTLKQLSLAQLATLAGIPKGPSVYNPISRPDKAKIRRAHVLARMQSQGYINQAQLEAANSEAIETFRHGAETTVSAGYLAEMAHMELINRYGREAAHSDGLKVYTSIDPKLQSIAQSALRAGLMEYDRRHGFREIEQHYEIDESVDEASLLSWISDFSPIGKLLPALVVAIEQQSAEILLPDGTRGKIRLEDSLWAKKYVDENYKNNQKLTEMTQIIAPGDVIRVLKTDRFEIIEPSSTKPSDDSNENDSLNALSAKKDSTENDPTSSAIATDANASSDKIQPHTEESLGLPIYLLSQLPDVNGGFVVLNPQNGAIEALIGGFNYSKSQFNMVTQARRQIGSNIKPFIYSAALNKGYTAASLINDSPIIDWDTSSGVFWRPENDNQKYRGPMRLRQALTWSVNTVSVRLIRKIGARYTKKYLQQIGFPAKHIPPFQSIALGSASFTPLEVAAGYATLANGGYRVSPWYIQRIEDSHGQILFEQEPIQVCEVCLATNKKAISASLQETEKKKNEDKNNTGGEKKTPERLNQLSSDAEKVISDVPQRKVAKEKIAQRVIDARNRYIIDDMLKDVIHRGTASRTLNKAKSSLLKRTDIAGKTGTTNESKDAWFSGYNYRYAASAWVGFRDHSKKLGKREFGAVAALPIWRRFMEKALDNAKQYSLPRPNGLVDVKIDLKNGKLASANTVKSNFEVFRVENVPTEYSEAPPEDINIFDSPDDDTDNDSENKSSGDQIDF